MAKYFREEEIEEFRDGFHWNARESKRRHDKVTTLDSIEELKSSMMSLGLSPTSAELRQYWTENNKKLTFPEFLEVVYKAKQVEQIPEDIILGFQAQDRKNKGKLPAADVRYMLQKFDSLSSSEVDRLFRDGGVKSGSKHIDYEEFAKKICSASNSHQATNNGVGNHYNMSNGHSMNNSHDEPLPDYY